MGLDIRLNRYPKGYEATRELFDEYDEPDDYREEISIDSGIDHMFRIGYFRSSYWIFDVNDDFEPVVDWEMAKKRCDQLEKEFATAMEKTPFRVINSSFNRKDPLKVVGIVSGVGNGLSKKPTTYIIYEDDGLNWYLDAIKIIRMTIDYVLSQPQEEQDQYRLSWSG